MNKGCSFAPFFSHYHFLSKTMNKNRMRQGFLMAIFFVGLGLPIFAQRTDANVFGHVIDKHNGQQ